MRLWLTEKALGADHEETVFLRVFLATILRKIGQSEDVVPLLEEARKRAETTLASAAADRAITPIGLEAMTRALMELGSIARRRNDLKEARANYQKASKLFSLCSEADMLDLVPDLAPELFIDFSILESEGQNYMSTSCRLNQKWWTSGRHWRSSASSLSRQCFAPQNGCGICSSD